jgi:hypothetical protein
VFPVDLTTSRDYLLELYYPDYLKEMLTNQRREEYVETQLVGECRAVAQAVTGFLRRQSVFEPGSSHIVSVVDRAALRQVSSDDFRFPLPLIHCTNCSKIITIIQV